MMQLISTDTHIGFDVLTAMYLLHKDMPHSILDFSAPMFFVTQQFILDQKDLGLNGPLKQIKTEGRICLTTQSKQQSKNNEEQVRYIYADEKGSFSYTMINQWFNDRKQVTASEAAMMLLALYEVTCFLSNEFVTDDVFALIAWLREQGANQVQVNKYFSANNVTYQSVFAKYIKQCDTELYQDIAVTFCTGRVLSSVAIHRQVVQEIVHTLAPTCFIAIFALNNDVIINIYAQESRINALQLVKNLKGQGDSQQAAAWVKNKAVAEIRAELSEHLLRCLSPEITAESLMTNPLLVANQYESIGSLYKRMQEQVVDWLPIVDDNNCFLGSVTFQALAQAISMHLNHASILHLKENAHLAIPQQLDLYNIRRIFRDNKVTKVAVVDEKQRLTGVVTLHDLLFQDQYFTAVPAPVIQQSEVNFSYILNHRLPLVLQNVFYWCHYATDTLSISCYLIGDFLLDLIAERPFSQQIEIVLSSKLVAFTEILQSIFADKLIVFESLNEFELRVDNYCLRGRAIERPSLFNTAGQQEGLVKQALFKQGFTVNSMAIQLHAQNFGQLLDFYAGYRDFNQGYLQILNHLAFVENPLLMLEAIRLEQKYGLKMADQTLQAFKTTLNRQNITTITEQDLRRILLKALNDPSAVAFILRLRQLGVLNMVFPGIRVSETKEEGLQRLQQLLRLWSDSNDDFQVMSVLLALLIEGNQRFLLPKMKKWLRAEEQARILKIVAEANRLLEQAKKDDSNQIENFLKTLQLMPLEVLIFTLCKDNDKVSYAFALNYLHLARYQYPELSKQQCVETCIVLLLMKQRKIKALDAKHSSNLGEDLMCLRMDKQKVENKWIALSQDSQTLI